MEAIPFEILNQLFEELPDVETFENEYIFKYFDHNNHRWATRFYVARLDGKKIWISNGYEWIPYLVDGSHKIT